MNLHEFMAECLKVVECFEAPPSSQVYYVTLTDEQRDWLWQALLARFGTMIVLTEVPAVEAEETLIR